ncbi:MAG: Sporulation kinase E [Pelotomaculum sp. PtaU1.Bin035]|nr:MAG: Sporulation kinase E [Pelotomaculum sp. PtaU1.Bin035]
MEMADKMKERQKELIDHLLTMHLLCIIVTLIGIILYGNYIYSNPPINLRFCFIINLIGFLVALLYLIRKRLLQGELKLLSLLNIIYVIFPLPVATITLFFARNNILYVKSILILPVLFAASAMGKKAGMAMATICAFYLVAIEMAIEKISILQAFEANLIITSMMYIAGWFVGVLIDNNKQYQEQLKDNILSLNREIAYRKQVEQENQKLSSVVKQSPSIIMIADINGNIEYVNPKFVQITGYPSEAVVGKKICESSDQSPEEYKQLWEVVASGGEWQGEFLNKKKNGDYYWESATISPFRNQDGAITHYLKVAEDITERKRVEKEMKRLDRLHLVGEMAAGIGHEVRNPMTTVRGLLQLLEKKEELFQHKQYYNLMIEELDRANSIITEFLSLAKNKAADLKVQNLNPVLEALSPLIMASATNSDMFIQLELEDIPDIPLDEKEMRQLILNLVRNGMEAMSPGGILAIRTFLDGEDVVMAVRDQGEGIGPDVLEKLGTPFFTTKDNGTGLGLSVCYSIAARHDATIKVKTSSEGTVFSVVFKPGGIGT